MKTNYSNSLARILLCGSLVLFASATASTEEWRQWRGDHRTGVVRNSVPLLESIPQEGLKPVWRITSKEVPQLRASGWSSPVVADGHLFLYAHPKKRKAKANLGPRKFPYLPPEKRTGMSDEEYAEYEKKRRDEEEARARVFSFTEYIYCLDATTGKQLWVNEKPSVYTRFAQSGTPAIQSGRLYILGAGRNVRCIDTTNGKELWSQRLAGEFRDQYMQSSVVVTDRLAVVLCGALFALDAKTGKVMWQIDPNRKSNLHSSPIVWSSSAGTRIIANLNGKETICVDQSGKEVWRVDSAGGNSTPILIGNKLLTYGNSRKKGLRCYNLLGDSLSLAWTFQRAADPGSTPVVVGDHVYLQGDRRLACVSLETGKATWQTSLDIARPRYSSLIAADNKVFYSFEGLLCFHAEPKQFRPIVNAKINNDGLLADETSFRKMLDLDELEKTAEGQKESERLWRKAFGNGPLACTTPAIVDGKIYLRLKNGIACYDLRKQ